MCVDLTPERTGGGNSWNIIAVRPRQAAIMVYIRAAKTSSPQIEVESEPQRPVDYDP